MFREILNELNDRDRSTRDFFNQFLHDERGPMMLHDWGYRGPGYYFSSFPKEKGQSPKMWGPFKNQDHARNVALFNDDIPRENVHLQYVDADEYYKPKGAKYGEYYPQAREKELERRRQLKDPDMLRTSTLKDRKFIKDQTGEREPLTPKKPRMPIPPIKKPTFTPKREPHSDEIPF